MEKEGKEIDIINRMTPTEFEKDYGKNNTVVIDVRKPGEYNAEHVDGAMNIPLDYINENLSEFPKDKDFIIHCAGGYRSMTAASILKSRGWENFRKLKEVMTRSRQPKYRGLTMCAVQRPQRHKSISSRTAHPL